ncbi:zinc knuckle CX2CX4HX4C containing protein [Tanacetum coccineum]
MENSDGMNKRKAFNVSIQYEHGDVLVAHMQRMMGNDGNAAAKQPRMPIRGLKNPNSELGLKDTNNSLSPTMESLVPKGDHINVSSYAGRTKPGLNEALKSVKTNVTSFGESTNPSWPTMNPSSVINSDVEQNIWSSSVPTGLNAANTSAKGIFTSFGESTNPSLSMNVPAESFEAEDAVPVPTRWTSYDQPSTAEPNSETPIVKATGVSTKDQTKVEANFRSLVADKVFDGRMAFLVIEYYAKNNWAKHGLKRIMMNAKGFFFFKFGTRAGLEAVLEGGPWMIRNSPIILKKWFAKTSLQKDKLTRIPIWVKLHEVPIQVFEEDGISLIATYLGKPILGEGVVLLGV